LSVTSEQHPRIRREKKTIEAMVRYYCKKKHEAKDELCPECAEFLNYAFLRLDKCPFQEKKSTCGKCTVHCYRPDMREKAKDNYALFRTKNVFVSSEFGVASCVGWA